MSQIHLSPKETEVVKEFMKLAQKYDDEMGTEYCVPLYTPTGELTLFERDTKKYQRYGYMRIKRLIEKGVFSMKVKKVKKDRKFLCMSEEMFSVLKSQA